MTQTKKDLYYSLLPKCQRVPDHQLPTPDRRIVAECWTCGRSNRLVAQPLRTPRYLYNNTTVNKHHAAGHDVRPVNKEPRC